MRYIPNNNLKIPDDWIKLANKAKDELINSDEERRAEIIKKKSAIWRDKRIRKALSKLSERKCWYCESRENRSDRVMDHFRPKSRVAERKDHPGYYWLAFDIDNFRYCCIFCNSLRKSENDKPAGGKADHFPIVDEKRRALKYADSLEDELPYLLDPRSEGDPLLITFTEDGRAIPRYDENKNSLHYKRAHISIKIYNLNHPDIKEARYTLCVEINELIKTGDRAFLRQEESPDAALVGKENFDDIVRRIRAMINKNAEFSRAVKAMLSFYRAVPWVESILEDSN